MTPMEARRAVLALFALTLEVAWVVAGMLATQPAAGPRINLFWPLLFALVMFGLNLRIADRKSDEARIGLALIQGIIVLFVTLQLSLFRPVGLLTPGKVFTFIWNREVAGGLLFLHTLFWLLVLWQRTLALAGQGVGVRTTIGRFRGSVVLIAAAWLFAEARGFSLPFALFFMDLVVGFSAVALARAESVSEGDVGQVPFNRRWVAMLAGALLLVFTGGWVAASLVARIDPAWLAPLFVLFDRLLMLVVIALIWVLEPLLRFLIALFSFVLIRAGAVGFLENLAVVQQEFEQVQVQGDLSNHPIFMILKVVATLVLAALVIFLIAASLQRLRERQRRASGAVHESVYEEGMLGRDLRALWRKGLQALRNTAGRFTPQSYGIATVRELYKNLQLYGTRHGTPRPVEATPAEYFEMLRGRLPHFEAELRDLTNAYIAAHYGERPFTRDEIRRLQAAWRRLEASEDGGN